MSFTYTIHPTPIGPLLLVAEGASLVAIRYVEKRAKLPALLAAMMGPAAEATEDPKALARFATALDDYFAGKAKALRFPTRFRHGTELQRAVWEALATIPYGKTLSYSALAARVGKPRAVRAVASACAANPLPLVFPCHRVIAKDGSLGGFSLGGVTVKAQLLAQEQA